MTKSKTPTPAKRPRGAVSDADQVNQFRATARELGADDDGGSDAVMKRLAHQKRPAQAKKTTTKA